MKFGMKIQNYVKVKTVFNFLINMAVIYFKVVQHYAIFNRLPSSEKRLSKNGDRFSFVGLHATRVVLT